MGDSYLRHSAKHCTWEGDECWHVRTHPVIDAISASEGYLSGGQELRISGFGLNGTDVQVTVDGVQCKVTSNSQEEIICLTGEGRAPSQTGVDQPGSPGLRSSLRDPEGEGTGLGWHDRYTDTHPIVEAKLMTSFETLVDEVERAGYIMDGWFKAPETGRYRFYLACDDVCQLNLDSEHPYGTEGQDVFNNNISLRTSWTSWRHYFDERDPSGNKPISDWIDLVEGEYYQLQGYIIEWGGGDHYSVAVEFEKANTEGHHHTNREVQVLSIEHENRGESWSCTVDNIDSGTFKLQFLNPASDPPSYWLSDEIDADGSANHFNNKVKGYIWENFRSGVTVTRDLEDTDAGPDRRAVYTVTLTRPIRGYSMNAASVVVVSTNATVTVNPPMTHTPSSKPLQGSYIITCPDPDDPATTYSTPEISVEHWAQGVDRIIQNNIPFLAFKTWVRDLRAFPWRDNGLRMAIIF